MNLESSIKDVISKKLEEGIVEKLIAEQLENGIKNALKDLLGSYGDVTKIIEKQIKAVMIPYLENYDYSEYITKLDTVLVDILKNSALENKKMLENFKELMIPEPQKTINITELFEQWMKHVAKNVETDGLDICYDDAVTYENVVVNFDIEFLEGRSWSDFEYALIAFECEHDEKMNFELKIHRWKKFDKEQWTIDYDATHNLNSLRYLNEFQILLMKLKQNGTRLILDSHGDEDEVEVEARPEPDYR
jgi:hypothetical protein